MMCRFLRKESGMRRISGIRLHGLSVLYLGACRFLADRRAVTSIEYAMIAATMVFVVIATMGHSGLNIAPTFSAVSSEL